MGARRHTVAVLGGGITGLAAAWELCEHGAGDVHVVLLESEEKVGGKLRTTTFGGRDIDLGPDAFIARRPEALSLCEEIGLADDLVHPGAGHAYVWSRGRLRRLPAGLVLGVPTRLGALASSGICSPAAVLRAGLDLAVPPLRTRGPLDAGATDAAVGPLVRRRLGRGVHDLLADPLIGGINAGGIDTMSAAAVFPQLLDAARKPASLMRSLRRSGGAATQPGPVFASLRGGMERLAQRLASRLADRGCEIRTNTRAESLYRSGGGSRWTISASATQLEADAVVIALPAAPAAALVARCDPVLEGLLCEIPYASVTVVTLRFAAESSALPLDGTGFLVPASQGRLLTACTWITSKWPQIDRPGDFVLRASMGRYGDERAGRMSDEELVRRSAAELDEMMGLRAAPLESLVTRWTAAFPQYLVGHPSRVEAAEDRARRLGNVVLAGAALYGVGIPSCIASARRAARQLLDTFEREEVRGTTR